MMEFTSALAGLSEIKDYWSAPILLRYLLLLAVLDAVSGLYIAGVIERCEVFTLTRYGYERWYHRAMLGHGAILCVFLAVLAGITCAISKDSVCAVWIAAAVLALNMLVISNFQMLITMLSGNVSLGYLICMFVQLLSVFLSERLPTVGKWLLIGNWGMALRSTLAVPGGLPTGFVIGTECFILIILWRFGWRSLRKKKRGSI